jgi:cytochrome c peroxidase
MIRISSILVIARFTVAPLSFSGQQDLSWEEIIEGRGDATRRDRSTAMAIGAAMLALPLFWSGPAASGDRSSSPPTRQAVRREARALTELGRALFFDAALSGSGRLACASCHDPAHGFAAPNALPVQLGGGDMRQPGLRAAPTLTYLQAVPAFTEHYFDSEEEADESIDNGPSGGLTWDGRVDRARDQARIPLLSPFEMGNADEAGVAGRVLAAGYGERIRAVLGADAALDTESVFSVTTKALETFQQDYRLFYPYSSKYDAVLAGKATLSAQEARGRALFDDPAKGNCASCHISEPGNDGTPPQFTDFGLIALGLPRNAAIPANRDPRYFDLGLCGPLRTDFLGREEYCGLFRTPTLRNVALRKSFFHNGVVHDLRRAVSFYVERETKPELWYAMTEGGTVDKYDDLPERYSANLNRDPPFDRKAGQAPALTDAEIDDVVAFLKTLTDGYRPLP